MEDCKPEHWHGTTNGYNNRKCRCQPCREAATADAQRRKLIRLAERVDVGGRLYHPRAPHGSATGYGAYGCRCEPCTRVYVLDVTARRDRRKARAE